MKVGARDTFRPAMSTRVPGMHFFGLMHLALSLTFFACSGESSGSGFDINLENCGGFTVADAAAILEVPVENIELDLRPLGDDGMWCVYNVKESARGLNFSITRSESVEDAVEEFERFKGMAGMASGLLGEDEKAPHLVEGVGDEAAWTPVPGALHVRKGRFAVQVNAPSEEERQIRIARKVLREE